MKTIEERAAIYFGVLEEKRLRRVVFEDILRELAADLNAEKEKEVAELRARIAELEEINFSGNEAFVEKLTKISEQSALLNEAKRVLGLINYGEHDNPNDEGNGPCLCSQCQFVRAKRQLLTRLGGSHE